METGQAAQGTEEAEAAEEAAQDRRLIGRSGVGAVQRRDEFTRRSG